MQTCRASFRSFLTYVQVTTIAALPYHFNIFLEYLVIFDVLGQCQVSFFVSLFRNGNFTVHLSDSRETFFVSDVGKLRIIHRPFFVFAFSSSFQILDGRTDDTSRKTCIDFHFTTFQPFEHTFCVFLFLVGCFSKNGRDLFETFFLCGTCKVSVTHSGL